jgi:uncharacterized protein
MIKTITKISFTTLLLLSFTACNNTKKEENEFKVASLPMPDSGKTRELGMIGLWHDAKKDPISATKIGYAYSEELKDYEKALEWYKYSDSMKSLPDNSNYACYALQQLKKYDEAISWCQKAIELGSDKALFQLATTYYEKNDFENSLLWFKKAYEKGNKNVYINIGLIYSKLKNYTEAENWYLKGIKDNDFKSYQDIAIFYHEDLKDNVKASAYAIAMINTKYTKSSVLGLLKNDWNISDDIIKKGYELQLNSPDFPIKYKGEL